MTTDLRYSDKQQILTIKVQGYLTVDSFEATVLSLLNSDDYYQDVNTMWDIREMQFDNIDMKFLKQVIKVQQKYAQRRGTPKIALLSNYFLAAPIIKLYLILSKGLKQKYGAFTSVEEAELWLCKDSSRR